MSRLRNYDLQALEWWLRLRVTCNYRYIGDYGASIDAPPGPPIAAEGVSPATTFCETDNRQAVIHRGSHIAQF